MKLGSGSERGKQSEAGNAEVLTRSCFECLFPKLVELFWEDVNLREVEPG